MDHLTEFSGLSFFLNARKRIVFDIEKASRKDCSVTHFKFWILINCLEISTVKDLWKKLRQDYSLHKNNDLFLNSVHLPLRTGIHVFHDGDTLRVQSAQQTSANEDVKVNQVSNVCTKAALPPKVSSPCVKRLVTSDSPFVASLLKQETKDEKEAVTEKPKRKRGLRPRQRLSRMKQEALRLLDEKIAFSSTPALPVQPCHGSSFDEAQRMDYTPVITPSPAAAAQPTTKLAPTPSSRLAAPNVKKFSDSDSDEDSTTPVASANHSMKLTNGTGGKLANANSSVLNELKRVPQVISQPPRVGSIISFRTPYLSSNMVPEVSSLLKAKVTATSDDELTLEFCDDCDVPESIDQPFRCAISWLIEPQLAS